MKALSIYEAGDGVKRKIATLYLNRHIGGKDGDNKNSHCSSNELEPVINFSAVFSAG